MKLNKNIDEIEGFISAVNNCKGRVWLESPDGDIFDLKPEFSRRIELGPIGILLGENDNNLELFCSLPEDRNLFYKYF